ncbi:hypothetical protein [Edaphobacter aggregans]|uniref:hypothetical protein n=1 Tax=Edaphobacter aggregans TaxID=570835 RepID=UPI000B0069E7|nr:hypothetical protein [Edaphobacter aggregans]
MDKFQEHFSQHRNSFALIGGVACHEWLASQGLPFRATKDLDVVLIIEALDQTFVDHFWQFIEAGQYEVREKAEGERELYRFYRPKDDAYPAMIEIFCRQPRNIQLGEGQNIVPIAAGEDEASLSAILLDAEYYQLIVDHRERDANPPYITPTALIPLKARAWLDLTRRKNKGEKVDSKDIDKHRTDVFRLAATLPGEPGPDIGASVSSDLKEFLASFPAESAEWGGILASLKTTFGNSTFKPDTLVAIVSDYFKLTPSSSSPST